MSQGNIPKTKESNSSEDESPDEPVDNAWKIKLPSFKKGDMKYSLQEESSFEIGFPKYREKYIQESWPVVEKLFSEHGIKANLNLLEGTMKVSTTRKTWDPYIILKARDVIKLLSRSVPLEHAFKVLKDEITQEIIKIKNLVRSKERLIKRRQRLIGPNGTTLKTLELLTNCYVLVQGVTVAAIGPHLGVAEVAEVVTGTMKNIHPIILLKILMVKKSLAQNPDKQSQDWAKFLPSYIKTPYNARKKRKIKPKKPYSQFPPARHERKEDMAMASGQYFVEEQDKLANKGRDLSLQQKKSLEKQKKKQEAFVPPQEAPFASHAPAPKTSTDVNLKKLKQRVKSLK